MISVQRAVGVAQCNLRMDIGIPADLRCNFQSFTEAVIAKIQLVAHFRFHFDIDTGPRLHQSKSTNGLFGKQLGIGVNDQTTAIKPAADPIALRQHQRDLRLQRAMDDQFRFRFFF